MNEIGKQKIVTSAVGTLDSAVWLIFNTKSFYSRPYIGVGGDPPEGAKSTKQDLPNQSQRPHTLSIFFSYLN